MNDKQVKLLRKKRFEDGLSQEAAAAWIGVCPKTARKWEKGLLPSQIKKPRNWRTRKDPLEGMWDEIIVPLLQRDEKEILEATTLLDLLKKKHPDTVSEKNLRTLQRRMRDWKALHGLPKEVFFTQEHPPGREGQIDFTHCDTLGVTIGGAAFPHLIFEFILSCSGYRWAQLASSETFEALSSGIQGAVWSFGGSPRCWRTDNLSAATHQLKSEGCWVLTERYQGLVDHYEVQSTRIAPGESNENGVVEKAHDTLKKHIAQALFLRGSSDFASIEAYWAFVAGIVEKLNASKREAFEEERKSLLPLPSSAVPFYSEYQRKVSQYNELDQQVDAFQPFGLRRDQALGCAHRGDQTKPYLRDLWFSAEEERQGRRGDHRICGWFGYRGGQELDGDHHLPQGWWRNHGLRAVLGRCDVLFHH